MRVKQNMMRKTTKGEDGYGDDGDIDDDVEK